MKIGIIRKITRSLLHARCPHCNNDFNTLGGETIFECPRCGEFFQGAGFIPAHGSRVMGYRRPDKS